VAFIVDLSVTFYPYHFVRTILSIPFCPIPFCPYHFVRYHFVFAPSEALPAQSRTKKTCGQNRHWAAEHFFLFIVNPVFLLISPPPSLSSNPLPVISLNSFSFFLHLLCIFSSYFSFSFSLFTFSFLFLFTTPKFWDGCCGGTWGLHEIL